MGLGLIKGFQNTPRTMAGTLGDEEQVGLFFFCPWTSSPLIDTWPPSPPLLLRQASRLLTCGWSTFNIIITRTRVRCVSLTGFASESVTNMGQVEEVVHTRQWDFHQG